MTIFFDFFLISFLLIVFLVFFFVILKYKPHLKSYLSLYVRFHTFSPHFYHSSKYNFHYICHFFHFTENNYKNHWIFAPIREWLQKDPGHHCVHHRLFGDSIGYWGGHEIRSSRLTLKRSS